MAGSSFFLSRWAAAVGAAILAPTCPCCSEEMGWGLWGVCESCWAEVVPGGPACLICGRPWPGRRCGGCDLGARRGTGPPWSAAVSIGDYDGRLRDLIHAFKFGGRPGLARPLAGLMADALARRGLLWEAGRRVVVPVPLGTGRRAARGYDQALLLARSLGRQLRRRGCGPARAVEALRRVKESPPQAGLGRKDRLANLEGAFRAVPGRVRPDGTGVLLVDDVLTTGATVEACIRALNREGAESVMVAVAARTAARSARGTT